MVCVSLLLIDSFLKHEVPLSNRILESGMFCFMLLVVVRVLLCFLCVFVVFSLFRF